MNKYVKNQKLQREQIKHLSNSCRVFENYIWDKLNADNNIVKELRNYAFEYACLDAEFLDLPKKGLTFKILCLMRRNIVYFQVKCGIEKLIKQNINKIKIVIEDYESLEERLRDFYRPNNTNQNE